MLVLVSLAGCNLAKTAMAISRSTDHFKVLEQDGRVFYEEGALPFASRVAMQLDAAIAAVESAHHQTFNKPVSVFVCHSRESFAAYCVNTRASGCVSNARLFLAPSSFEKDSFVLSHELSHLHMAMQLDSIFWYLKAPVWFHEGLAVYAAKGEGARDISTEEAAAFIVAGRSFVPNSSVNIFSRKTPASFNLGAHLFYRQAAMFVAFLHDIDEEKFKTFIVAVAGGKAFASAFTDAYHQSIENLWDKFVQLQVKPEQRRQP